MSLTLPPRSIEHLTWVIDTALLLDPGAIDHKYSITLRDDATLAVNVIVLHHHHGPVYGV